MKGHSKIKKAIKWSIPFVATALLSLSSPVKAQNGETTFKTKCAACHSIGHGKFVGPDLKDLTQRRKEEWIIKFVKGSQAFVKEDADAKALFSEYNVVMPDFPLSDGEIKDVIKYIDSKSAPATASAPAADSAAKEAPKEVVPERSFTATPADILLGKQLFEGSVAFKNGGPSCQSCHNVNYPEMLKGGVLAKDLSNCYSRLGGDAGIAGMLGAPPFPAMAVAFKDKPITNEEVNALVAFLNKADKLQGETAKNSGGPLLIGGLTVLTVILGAIWITWVYRKQKMVKQNIYDRQIKTIKHNNY